MVLYPVAEPQPTTTDMQMNTKRQGDLPCGAAQWVLSVCAMPYTVSHSVANPPSVMGEHRYHYEVIALHSNTTAVNSTTMQHHYRQQPLMYSKQTQNTASLCCCAT